LGRTTARKDTSSGPPLVVAAPNFDAEVPQAGSGENAAFIGAVKPPSFRFPHLSSTQAEADMIQKHFPDAVVLSGISVTRELIEARNNPRFVHFATHGYCFGASRRAGVSSTPATTSDDDDGGQDLLQNFDTRSFPMLRSGLAISGVNAWLESLSPRLDTGLYSAEEILSLDLDGTDFVVVAACVSGLGKPIPGQGVQGLRSALRNAGANVLVTTLWEVDDAAAIQLMTQFYQRMAEAPGCSCQSALRASQLAIRNQPGKGHPAWWGGFICDGAWA